VPASNWLVGAWSPDDEKWDYPHKQRLRDNCKIRSGDCEAGPEWRLIAVEAAPASPFDFSILSASQRLLANSLKTARGLCQIDTRQFFLFKFKTANL